MNSAFCGVFSTADYVYLTSPGQPPPQITHVPVGNTGCSWSKLMVNSSLFTHLVKTIWGNIYLSTNFYQCIIFIGISPTPTTDFTVFSPVAYLDLCHCLVSPSVNVVFTLNIRISVCVFYSA